MNLPFVLEEEASTDLPIPHEDIALGLLHAGDTCPVCQKGVLDYDGMLNLSCQECGFSIGGCFT